jgi:hypothetical protein
MQALIAMGQSPTDEELFVMIHDVSGSHLERTSVTVLQRVWPAASRLLLNGGHIQFSAHLHHECQFPT